jgi:GntR family transcriptional regulator, transcriptional repressor for pyruvate dehydrogenase complex
MNPHPTTDSEANPLVGYIVRGGLEVGARLPSLKELARELNLGVQAVRDALIQAQMMGLVRVQPRSGCYVQAVSFSPLVEAFSQSLPRVLNQEDRNLFDLLEARRILEMELVVLAASRRRLAELVELRAALTKMYADPHDHDQYMMHNEEFHLGIARIAGNKVLSVLLRSLFQLLRQTMGAHDPAAWEAKLSDKRRRDQAEHEAIFAALLAGDPDAARSAMAAHLQDTTASLLPSSPPDSDRNGV